MHPDGPAAPFARPASPVFPAENERIPVVRRMLARLAGRWPVDAAELVPPRDGTAVVLVPRLPVSEPLALTGPAPVLDPPAALDPRAAFAPLGYLAAPDDVPGAAEPEVDEPLLLDWLALRTRRLNSPWAAAAELGDQLAVGMFNGGRDG